MELRHLRYFVAVAEAENVTRAARTLHVSQPALSRQVRDLEEELGFALLERTAKSVKLTEAGRVFLTEAKAVVERADLAVRTARAVANATRVELHVGYAPTLTARSLPSALRAFQAAHPKVRVHLHDASTEEMVAGLCEGRLDLAFSVRPAVSRRRGLHFEMLFQDPLRLAVAPTHPFVRRRSIPLSEAAQQPFVAYSRREYPDYHELLASIFRGPEAAPLIAEEHDGVSSLISAVAAGSGVALVTQSLECLAGVRLRLLPLTPPPKPLSVGALLPKSGLAPLPSAFLECMRATATHPETGP